ncbi:ArsR family transcriptional regulator [Candidatus Woesearchaeota archaeon]|nr:ArsR family transcriptional regulator [Candidatus Woesearchaeota archaeon]
MSNGINGKINGKSSRRRFEELRLAILRSLSKGQKTINQIAAETGINWRTVELHLTYLAGRGLVVEIFSSSYVRIFQLSTAGKDELIKRFSRVKIEEKKLGARLSREQVIEL